LHRGIELGLVRSCDPHIVASFVLGGFKETAYRLIVREVDRPEMDQVVDELMSTSLVGLLERPSSEAAA
jgi:hypothetical protein